MAFDTVSFGTVSSPLRDRLDTLPPSSRNTKLRIQLLLEMSEELSEIFNLCKTGEFETLEARLLTSPELLQLRDERGFNLLCLLSEAAACRDGGKLEDSSLEKALEVIFAAGANPNTSSNKMWTPLHLCAQSSRVKLAKKLVQAGADPQAELAIGEGGTPLALALFYGQREMAESLASPPSPYNLRTAAALGRPFDHFLEGSGLSDKALVGLDFYRPLEAFPVWNREHTRQEILNEALTWSSRNGRIDSVRELLRLGAEVNSNPYRGTALLWAVFADRVETAEFLLNQGADPNLAHDFGGQDHGKGAVAMHLAAQYGCLECLRLLLQRGADATIKDESFQSTPRAWAEHAGNTQALAVLDEFQV